MPTAALSPGIHAWGMLAALELNDRDDAELERFQYDCCLQGLEATGDGSQRHPYQVTYASDPHDLLESRGIRVERQELREKGDRRFDVITCEDRATVWFDVTPLIAARPQLIVHRPAVSTTAVRKPRKKAFAKPSRRRRSKA